VLSPAIKDADLEPYRVDQDPGVSIPIQSIEDGIQSSYVCLADISLDNPNVWFEVGYAIAAGKEVVFICSSSRQTKFPFDVQHRTITEYSTASPRDFKELQVKITQRLKAIQKSNQELGVVSKLSPTQTTEGLAPHEVAALVIMMENHLSPDSHITPNTIEKRMQQAGFTSIAVGIALHGLNLKGYMDYETDSDYNGNNYTVCAMSAKGLQWIQDNQSSLVLRTQSASQADEDIPF
jgi:hypothetical protein